MPQEFIYTTYRLARHYPPDKTVLENISISFYPGAKIGVIGSNGAGKSSLLRIMAGLDDGFTGEARLTPGFTVGYLSQEPELDPNKTVKEVVEEGVAETTALLKEYEDINEKFGLPEYYEDADAMEKLMNRQGELQEVSRDPFSVYQKGVLESVEGAQKAFKMLETNAQAMTRSAERLQVTAEQTGKEIQATFTQVAGKVKTLSSPLA